MDVSGYVASQFAHPRGAAAPFMAGLLNAVNKKVNQRAIDAAGIRPGHTVVDVGFGGGVGLERALRAVGEGGRVFGVDPSKEMVARARRRFRKDIRSGHLTVAVGKAEELPVDASTVDVAYTVNTTYFWSDVAQGLTEMRRVLAPGGRAVLAVQPSVVARHERFSGLRPASPDELAAIATSCGFGAAHVVPPESDVALVVAEVQSPPTT